MRPQSARRAVAFASARRTAELQPLTLRARTGELARANEPFVLAVGCRAARALAELHDCSDRTGRPLVHGALAPNHVLVSPNAVVELTGGARPAGRPYVGVAGYMPPEQLRGAPLDARVDLYALGVILSELLAKTPLRWDGSLDLDRLPAAVRAIARLSYASAGLEDLLVSMVDPLPRYRPRDATEVERRLAQLLIGEAPEQDGPRDESTVVIALPTRRRATSAHGNLAVITIDEADAVDSRAFPEIEQLWD